MSRAAATTETEAKPTLIGVLGYALPQDGKPHQIMVDRVAKAMELYHETKAKGESAQIIFSGGLPQGKIPHTEASVMQNIAMHPGKFGLLLEAIPQSEIILDPDAKDTNANILFITEAKKRAGKTIIVTSDFHAPRIQALLGCGFTATAEDATQFQLSGSDQQFDFDVIGATHPTISEDERTALAANEPILIRRLTEEDRALNRSTLVKQMNEKMQTAKTAVRDQPIDAEILAGHFNLENKALDLCCQLKVGHKLTDTDINTIVAFAMENSVTNLDLSGNDLGDTQAEEFLQQIMTRGLKLTSLNLDSNNLTHAILTPLTTYAGSPLLCPESLNLGHNNIGVESGTKLISLTSDGYLKQLYLHANTLPITEFSTLLNGVQRSATLESLNCRGCNSEMITSDLAELFAIVLQKLKSLNLADCGVDDTTMSRLAANNQLEEFHCYGNKLSVTGMENLIGIVRHSIHLTEASAFGYPLPADESGRDAIIAALTAIRDMCEEHRSRATEAELAGLQGTFHPAGLPTRADAAPEHQAKAAL